MDILRDVLLVLHFVGLASLLGGFLVQIKPATKVVNAAMVHGVLTQLVTGIGLVGVWEASDAEVDHMKVTAKLLITLAVALVVFLNRRKESISVPLWAAIGGLTFVNITVAVVW